MRYICACPYVANFSRLSYQDVTAQAEGGSEARCGWEGKARVSLSLSVKSVETFGNISLPQSVDLGLLFVGPSKSFRI